MIRVVLIGSGNVAIHLANTLNNVKGFKLVQRYSRADTNRKYFNAKLPKTNNLKGLLDADVYIIAISDDAISKFSKQLTFKGGLVVHTSGSVPMSALKCKAKKGVFYPVQTFSKDREVDFRNIPIAFEVEKKEDFELMEKLSKSISDYTYNMNSRDRFKLHIAAVFANNFTNHMYKIAEDLCSESKISFDILKPLIMETATKVQAVLPEDAQTGPAIRNDQKIIKNQLKELDNNKKEIYTLVTKSIIQSLK